MLQTITQTARHMAKRLLSLLLALALLCALLPLTTLTARADDPVYSGTCGAQGDNLTWTFDPDTGVLTIEGSGAMKDSYNLAPWYSFRNAITTVSLPDGITTISRFAFYDCDALIDCSFPDSLRSIGAYAFFGCDSLTKMVFRGNQAYIDTLEFITDFNGCEDTPEDLSYVETLGPKKQVAVYGPSTGSDGDYHLYDDPDGIVGHFLYFDMCPSYFAETCGYTFYATDSFTDVPADKWYTLPVAWAYGRGITSGTGNGRFSPNATCTREQIATFIWKAYDAPEPGGTENPFTDVNPEKYYAPAVLWAYYHEPQITGGMNATTFGVGKACTRAQVVMFLWAAAGKPEPTTTENPFTDVMETDYFYKAVLWAVENGVTSGVSPTSFAPKKTCTRAQVVTFLYKAVG